MGSRYRLCHRRTIGMSQRPSWTDSVCPVCTPRHDFCVRFRRWDHPIMANRNRTERTNLTQTPPSTNDPRRSQRNERRPTRGINRRDKKRRRRNKKKKRNGTEGTIALEIGIPTNRNTKKVLPRYSITGKHHNKYDKHIIVI